MDDEIRKDYLCEEIHMKALIEKLFSPVILPGILVGLSSHVLKNKFPELSFYIGWASLVILLISTASYLVYYSHQKIIPLRFANLIYLIYEDIKSGEILFAMIFHPKHERRQPPGSRLMYHEGPHQAIHRVLKNELGIFSTKDIRAWSLTKREKYANGDVEFVPTPIQVQLENHKQRLGIKAHYDFVYLCKVVGNKPDLKSELDPKWFSIDALKEIRDNDSKRCPFADVFPTLERALLLYNENENWVEIQP